MTKTIFIRLLDDSRKDVALIQAISQLNGSGDSEKAHFSDPDSFSLIPGSPLGYWVGDSVRELFSTLAPFEGNERTIRVGLQTSDDFRFLRLWWETEASNTARSRDETVLGKRWVAFAKGGEYSPYHADVHLQVNWQHDGYEIKSWASSLYGGQPWSRRIQNIRNYFLPGITWSLRSQKGMSFRPYPAGSIFSNKGPVIFAEDTESLPLILALASSSTVHGLVELQMAFGSYEVGVIQRTPFADVSNNDCTEISEFATGCVDIKRDLDRSSETSHLFTVPALLRQRGLSLKRSTTWWNQYNNQAQEAVQANQERINEQSAQVYGVSATDRTSLEISAQQASTAGTTEDEEEADLGESVVVDQLLSYSVGCVFGRWDIRTALDTSLELTLQGPFEPLPVCPPSMLVGINGLPATADCIASATWLRARPNSITLPATETGSRSTIPAEEYPLRINWDGVLVQDAWHPDDIVRRAQKVFNILWGEQAGDREREACEILGVRELKDYINNPRRFFDFHLKQYSKSRRKAPIYWPLSTASGSYTIWLYYPRLTSDTIYTAVNKYLNPKITSVDRSISDMGQSLVSASGGAATQLQRDLEREQELRRELIDMRDELLRIAALPYHPNLDDGAIINAAPFHRLFRHRAWAKATEDTWKKLEKGDYDWAHLAYTIWPDRVRDVCRSDKSIAIAHGLEDLYVEAPATAKKGKGRTRQQALTEEDA